MELRNDTTYNENEFPPKVKEFIRDNWGELSNWYLYILMESGDVLEFIPNVVKEMEYDYERRFFEDGDFDYYGPNITLDPEDIKDMDVGDENPFKSINEYGRMQELAGLKQDKNYKAICGGKIFEFNTPPEFKSWVVGFLNKNRKFTTLDVKIYSQVTGEEIESFNLYKHYQNNH